MFISKLSEISETRGASLENHFIGDLISGAVSFFGGERQNASNRSSAREANEHNMHNYKNRHQWEVADLKAAGLNPMLSANAGGAVGSAPAASAPSNSMGEGISTALQARRLSAEIEAIKSQTAKTQAETQGVQSDNERRKAYGSVWSRVNQVIGDIGPAINSGYGAAKSAASSALSGGDHFLTDAKGNNYNYPPRGSSAQGVRNALPKVKAIPRKSR